MLSAAATGRARGPEMVLTPDPEQPQPPGWGSLGKRAGQEADPRWKNVRDTKKPWTPKRVEA